MKREVGKRGRYLARVEDWTLADVMYATIDDSDNNKDFGIF
jgi:hypothetical protein